MDRQGFRELLQARQVPDEELDAALALAERFERFATDMGGRPAAEVAWAFSTQLIAEGQNTWQNYVTLLHYGRFTGNNPLFAAFLELLDGAEAQGNLYRRVGEVFGDSVRDEVFAGIGLAPLGLPTPDKPRFVHPVIEMLQARVGAEACRALLAEGLRDLPDEGYAPHRQRYEEAGDVDEYLRQRKQAFVEQLLTCQREGRPFFAQEVDEDVVALVEGDPEMGGGRREGSIVYEVKIPFLTRLYLDETDPTLKRYYYCHCPWAREAIKNGDVSLEPALCNCSAAFHVKPWRAIFGRSIRVDVLESVLQGDDRCRFAIHLPLE